MCFSFEVSLVTFFISWSISFYLLQKNLTTQQMHYIYVLLIYSSMQLADSILWYNNMRRNNINYYVTSFMIPFILSLQVYYNLFIYNNIKNIYAKVFFIIVTLYIFYRFNGYSSSICDNKLSSPIWGSNEIKLWEILIFIGLVFYPTCGLGCITSLIFVFIAYMFLNGAYGSLWCAFANLIAVYYLLTF